MHSYDLQFCTYGAFFLVYGTTLIPYYGAVSSFADPSAITADMNAVQAAAVAYQSGAMSVPFNARIAFLATFMALLTFIHLIVSIRTNVFFVIAFVSLLLTFIFFAVSRFAGADGDLASYEYCMYFHILTSPRSPSGFLLARIAS